MSGKQTFSQCKIHFESKHLPWGKSRIEICMLSIVLLYIYVYVYIHSICIPIPATISCAYKTHLIANYLRRNLRSANTLCKCRRCDDDKSHNAKVVSMLHRFMQVFACSCMLLLAFDTLRAVATKSNNYLNICTWQLTAIYGQTGWYAAVGVENRVWIENYTLHDCSGKKTIANIIVLKQKHRCFRLYVNYTKNYRLYYLTYFLIH